MAIVYIPTMLRSLTGDDQQLEIEGTTVRQIVEKLEARYPGVKERLVESNRLKPNISVAVDGDVSPLGMLEKVGESSEVHFLPAIGGGDAR